MALKCQCMAYPAALRGGALKDLNEKLISLGVTPTGTGGESGDGRAISAYTDLPVLVNGKVVGSASTKLCKSIASQLRSLKVEDTPEVPPTLEVAFIPPGDVVYLFSRYYSDFLLTKLDLFNRRYERRSISWTFSFYNCG